MKKSSKITKKSQIEFIRLMISTRSHWAIRALERVRENQTTDEKTAHMTKHTNKVGFTGFDADFLESLYEHKNSLTEKQLAALMRIMPKYSAQLWEACNKTRLLEKMLDYDSQQNLVIL